MQRQTFTYIAPSGFEYELHRMQAYHQEWLTQGKSSGGNMRGAKKNKSEKKAEDIMADILVRIDDDTNITPESLLNIPSWDFKQMLFVARYFSCDIHFIERMDEWNKHQDLVRLWNFRQLVDANNITDEELEKEGLTREFLVENELLDFANEPEYVSALPPHIFKFRYEWNENDEVQFHDYEVPLHFHDFKIQKPFRSFTWQELKQGLGADALGIKDVKLKLPISGETIVWHMLDLNTEEKFRGGFQPDDLNVNTSLKMRNPRYLNEKTSEPGKFIPSQANISKLEYLDIEQYRIDVWEKEGKVDSLLTLELPQTGKLIKVDVLSTATFFIPSGVL